LVSRILSERESQTDANREILRMLCEFLEYDFGQVWVSDPRSAKLVAVDAWQSQPGKYESFEEVNREIRFDIEQGLPGRVWETGSPLWISDVSQYPGFGRAEVATKEGFQTALAFPIMVGTEVLSVVELFGKKEGEPDDDLLRLMGNIGNHIGQFYARKTAEKEKARLTGERLLILDCASEGIFGIDLEGCTTFINRSASRMLGCEAANVIGKSPHPLFHHTRPDGSA
jgi:PAS domain-containing protein